MAHQDDFISSRRQFLLQGSALAAGAVCLGVLPLLSGCGEKGEEVEVTPTEDLMQEHGVLRRLLLVFEDISARLDAGQAFPHPALEGAIDLNIRFVQDYHEKDEEEYIFPSFYRDSQLAELVKVLLAQHQAGRRLTAQIKKLATPAGLQSPLMLLELKKYLDAFIRMYRPHAAREDTVLYPAFRARLSRAKFAALGEKFEDKEEKLFGKHGFAKIVAEVAGLEKQLGIYDLAQFTPRT